MNVRSELESGTLGLLDLILRFTSDELTLDRFSPHLIPFNLFDERCRFGDHVRGDGGKVREDVNFEGVR